MILSFKLRFLGLIAGLITISSCSYKYDIVIYGATSSGIAAAVQSSRMGKSVIVIEPTGHIGGLTTGGLGATDIGNKQAIGGISREFYQRIAEKYAGDKAWDRQKPEEYFKNGLPDSMESMWTFEPKVAQHVYEDNFPPSAL